MRQETHMSNNKDDDYLFYYLCMPNYQSHSVPNKSADNV